MSDIRVSVQWKKSTVFAGEEIECTITFKNVAKTPIQNLSPLPNSKLPGHDSPRDRWKETLPTLPGKSPNPAVHRSSDSVPESSHLKPQLHRQAISARSAGLSNGSVPAPAKSFQGSAEGIAAGQHKHRRSLSIVSIGGEQISQSFGHAPRSGSNRPGQGHARAASLQVLPRRRGLGAGTLSSATSHERAVTVPSPLLRSSSSYAEQRIASPSSSRSSPLANINTDIPNPLPGNADRTPVLNVKSPQIPPSINAKSGFVDSSIDRNLSEPSGKLANVGQNENYIGTGRPNLATRILSPASVDDTPRSSGEFYSMSNNSTETLASEYPTQEDSRLINRPGHSRQSSYLAPKKALQPEILMMGYGQLMGSFILDGSLVNQGSFEQVKKKGLIGGQDGGGVVRSDTLKRESGILGSFGWGNIGESLIGLLGSNELSSIKETKSGRNSKTVPVLSTPQSVLFVDLRLAPGESKSFSYKHPLPMGLPPSHKGRAIKISYNLVIGTQRAAKLSQQNMVKHVEIPFRVLPSVNSRGETLGHDLMSPHTILSSMAEITSLENNQQPKVTINNNNGRQRSTSPPTDFAQYVQSLLDRSNENTGQGLLSPTASNSRTPSFKEESPTSVKESIDLAILRSNLATPSKQSSNRFKINRSGDHVAVITLARPAYRLGEAVPVFVDFREADIRCYALYLTLESTESVDPAIALRSKASVLRATKRIHNAQRECTIASRRVWFEPTIPISATPDFITSGISLEWSLRFEFVTSRLERTEEEELFDNNLMEEIDKDERGNIKAAAQVLPCEVFDVTVPLRVYGATTHFDELNETPDMPI